MEERLGFISLEKLHHFYKKSITIVQIINIFETFKIASDKNVKGNTKKSGFNSIGGRKRKPARMIPLNLLL